MKTLIRNNAGGQWTGKLRVAFPAAEGESVEVRIRRDKGSGFESRNQAGGASVLASLGQACLFHKHPSEIRANPISTPLQRGVFRDDVVETVSTVSSRYRKPFKRFSPRPPQITALKRGANERDGGSSGLAFKSRFVATHRAEARTFLSAGAGDFLVARSSGRVARTIWNTGLESPVNPQTGMSALRGSRGERLDRARALYPAVSFVVRGAILLCACLLLAPRLAAQPAAITAWSTNEFQTAGFGTNTTFRVRTDAGGNVFVGTTVVNPQHGHPELAVFKYSATGVRLWSATYDHLDAHLDHSLAGLEVDQAGNVYLAGTAVAGPGGGDWVILKYSPGGTRLWATNYGTPTFDNPVGLAVDERGFVAVAGNCAQGATIQAVRFNAFSGAVSGSIGVSPQIGTNRVATAMTTDAAGNVWVVGSSGTNCLTLRFAAIGPGLVSSGKALSPATFGPTTGRAIAWSSANNLVFVLAAVQGTTPPVRQLVLCYSNLPYPTIPLFSGWHPGDAIPGTFLKPVIVRPSSPTLEDPVAIAVGPGGGVLTLAQADTSLGKDWVVTGWNPIGSAYAETDSTLGPAGSLPTFQNLFAAALAMDADGNVIVTGSGKNASPDADFATVRYAAPGSGTPLARHWFHQFDFTNGVNDARSLALDVAGNVLVTGPSLLGTNRWLTTLKLAQGPPRNDFCTNAMTVRAGTVAFSTRLATDSSPAVGACGANRQDVWFKWTAPASGLTEVDTLGSGFDTVLAVYTGGCGALTQVAGACNDNATSGRPNGTPQSFVSFPAMAGTNYFIQVGAATGGQGGSDGRLTLFGPLPAPGTCPPPGGPGGRWRKFFVLGSGTGTEGGLWRLTVPGCMDVSGVTATSVGAPASVLASNLAFSINTACSPGKIQAVSVANALYVRIVGCPPDDPVFLRIGPTSTQLNELCLLADAPSPGPLNPVTPPTCSYNPELAAAITVADCNGNSVADEVDLASGVSQDSNSNQIPDECEGGLLIAQVGTQGVLLWGVLGYSLESTTDPTSTTSWSPYPGTSPVFVPFTDSARFFRLQAAP